MLFSKSKVEGSNSWVGKVPQFFPTLFFQIKLRGEAEICLVLDSHKYFKTHSALLWFTAGFSSSCALRHSLLLLDILFYCTYDFPEARGWNERTKASNPGDWAWNHCATTLTTEPCEIILVNICFNFEEMVRARVLKTVRMKPLDWIKGPNPKNWTKGLK